MYFHVILNILKRNSIEKKKRCHGLDAERNLHTSYYFNQHVAMDIPWIINVFFIHHFINYLLESLLPFWNKM